MITFLIRKYHKLWDSRFEFPSKLTHGDIADFIADTLEQGWTQGADARDINGNEVHYKSKDAVEYSINGAIDFTFYKFKTTKKDQKETWLIYFAMYLINDVDLNKWSAYDPKNYPGGYRMFLWNDHPEQTQEQVIKAVRDYAAKARNSWDSINLVRRY